jgi:hypothetical protein
MDYFKLTRAFWDFAFENPEKIKPNHCALYLFIVEHCNRLGWKKKFGLPTEMSKEAIGIRSYNTYIQTLNELVEFGLIELIEKSKNQFSSNIVAISNFDKALDKALDKASIKHATKQDESTIQSIDSIDKQYTYNNIHNTSIEIQDAEIIEFSFDDFWILYPNKTNKKKAEEKFNKLTKQQKEKIENHLPFFINNKPFKEYNFPHATTYLNQERFNDEIIINNNNNGITKLTDTEQFKLITEAIKSTGVKR